MLNILLCKHFLQRLSRYSSAFRDGEGYKIRINKVVL